MWKVPEKFRLLGLDFGKKGEPFGAFLCDSPFRPGYTLVIIASPGGRISDTRVVHWEHVSVHAAVALTGNIKTDRTPTWEEMDYVKGLFWDDSDVVMQLHINDGNKVNNHPHTLHLWRPTRDKIPLPDKDLV